MRHDGIKSCHKLSSSAKMTKNDVKWKGMPAPKKQVWIVEKKAANTMKHKPIETQSKPHIRQTRAL